MRPVAHRVVAWGDVDLSDDDVLTVLRVGAPPQEPSQILVQPFRADPSESGEETV